jgi:DNA-binding SARP family transcriptional activator
MVVMAPRSISQKTVHPRPANGPPTLRENPVTHRPEWCYMVRVDIRLLGPLDVVGDDGAPLQLAGNRQKALLAALALRPGIVVSTDQLVDEIWGEDAPKTAGVSLQNGVAALRKSLGPDVVVTRHPGYLLDVPRDAVDAYRFERLVGEARRVPPEARRHLLDQALALWRGPPLAELTFTDFAQAEIRRLDELRLTAQEERIAADVDSGRASESIGDLEALAAEHPLREELRRLHMLALYRAGRQAEALAVFQATRAALVEELGIEPGPSLQELHAAILRHEVAPVRRPETHDGNVEGEIVRAALSGRLVPVLGVPGLGELAGELANTFALRDGSPSGLARVAQQIATLNGPGPLRDELHARICLPSKASGLDAFLARLPPVLRERGLPHQLIVSTRYDQGLERAFAELGEELDVVTYAADGHGTSRFWHRPPGADPRPIDVPNTYVAALSLERRTVLLRLQGAVDSDEARVWESFVVTEDDYIGYPGPGELAAALPVSLGARLRRSHLLFLGYTLEDWWFRLVRARIVGDARLAYRSWAVSEDPGPLERALWRRLDIEVVDADPEAFCDVLRARIEAA